MRKTICTLTAVAAACMLTLFACRKNASSDNASTGVSDEVLTKIYNLGFSNNNVIADGKGNYIVEGDILISEADLNAKGDVSLLRVGGEEQYRTTNLVRNLPRTITVSLSSSLSTWSTALNTALSRYNALGLRLTFTRVTSGANISIVNGSGSFLASSGFPTSSGNPYSQVILNSSAVAGQPNNTVASILAHEIGHCIGFRHTDYFNRSYSCGGSAVNEGSAGIGAINIPGTPTGADPNSWMLSCIGSGQNRPFNANDIIALNYLY